MRNSFEEELEYIKCMDIDKISYTLALLFYEMIIITKNYSFPNLEINDDTTIAFTWRNPDGIISISFECDGRITWASYIKGLSKKGHFIIKLN